MEGMLRLPPGLVLPELEPYWDPYSFMYWDPPCPAFSWIPCSRCGIRESTSRRRLCYPCRQERVAEANAVQQGYQTWGNYRKKRTPSYLKRFNARAAARQLEQMRRQDQAPPPAGLPLDSSSDVDSLEIGMTLQDGGTCALEVDGLRHLAILS